MEKYIEEIIEIVLENVSCDHPQRDEYSPGGIGMAEVEYSLMNEKKVIKKAIAALPARLIEKPLLTEKFMKQKVLEMMINFNTKGKFYDDKEQGCRKILDSIINELAAKINLKGD